MPDTPESPDSTPGGAQSMFAARIEEALFKARRVFLFGEINQTVAKDVCQKLVALADDSDDDISVWINSQGGHVEAGDTIFDVIRFVGPRVKILGTGWVASAGAHIYLSVPREDRFSLPNTRYMLHQPMGGVRGQASDIGIEAEEIVKMRRRLNQVIADQTGQPLDKVEKDTDRNFWMNAEEAKAYGIVGQVVSSHSEL
ncbi:MAG: ATP-dependent Clp protease proteolytic subunit [Deltaproteobacteria bacterium]|nr:ATP-dependent Clp protease proteolytic subunit [Deltaproteobacteria bacterium]MBW2414136.1 ATP-dependent Clp protease proteolytic subunit [Deltaproteobacteria bacterium]